MITQFPKKRINNTICGYSDIIWFAVDREGYVICANSMEGLIPPFVSEDTAKAEILAYKLVGEPAVAHARNFTPRDKYYYYELDCSDPYNETDYIRKYVPENPVKLQDLSEDIRTLLSNQTMDISASSDVAFIIK